MELDRLECFLVPALRFGTLVSSYDHRNDFEAPSELTGLTARGTSTHLDAESSRYDQTTTSDISNADTTVAGWILGRRVFSAR